MSTDVIELESSDDELEPVPKKKKIMPELRIPPRTQFPVVSVKPAKYKKNLPCLGINNTLTISHPRRINNSLVKPILKKLSAASGSSNRTNLFSPKPTSSKLLKNLPPSITVKKATTSKIVRNPLQKPKLDKTAVGQVVLPLCNYDESMTLSKPITTQPQWYKTPEDFESQKQRQNKNTISMEEKNNTEPAKLIEITIEDSPVKVSAAQQMAIIIDDSPVKDASKINNDFKQEKEKQSKKMLNYEKNYIVRDSMGMIEVEVDAIDVKQIRNDSNGTQSKEMSHEDELQKVVQLVPPKLSPKTRNKTLDSEKNITTFVNEEREKVKESVASGDEEFNSFYQKFIDTCLRIENSNDMHYIVEKKIKSYYRQCPKEYVDSEEFLDLVTGKIIAIEASPNKMYLYIRDVVNELNIQRKMSKAGTSKKNNKSADCPDISTDTSNCNTKRQRQINKLEKTLTKLHRAIQKLEEEEIDFEEEDDSIYLLTERYKERFLRIHAKFCQLTQTKMPSEPYVKLDSLPGRPKGPAARLEKWINKKVPIGKPLTFPDFHDVLRCVREANTEDKLGWSEMEILEEARELFISCGKKLKRRRQENEWRIAASRLPVNEDPAENDMELKKKLDQNKMVAKRNETNILNKYVDRQNQLNLEPEVIGDKEAEESSIESDEDSDTESNVMQTDQTDKVEKNETEKVETYAESNKDDSNLLQKLYSESDSDSPINLTDSENDVSFATAMNTDVISIEDSSYSESENCIDSAVESNSHIDISNAVSEDVHIGDTRSNNKEYLTVEITDDIQMILSSKDEIREKASGEDPESAKECIDNVDKSNEIEIISDKSINLRTEITDLEINNIEVGMNANTIDENNSSETKMITNIDNDVVQLKDKQIQGSKKSTELTQVENELDMAEVTDTNKNNKEKCNIQNETKDINTDDLMKDNNIATINKPINVNKEVDVVYNTDIEPFVNHADEKEITAEETINNNEENEKSPFEIKIPKTHIDLEISDSNMMIEHTDVDMNDTDIIVISNRDSETNVKSADKPIDAHKDDITIKKNNGDSETTNVRSGVHDNKHESKTIKAIEDVVIKNDNQVCKSIIESNIIEDCSTIQVNDIDCEKIENHTDDATNEVRNVSVGENSITVPEISTETNENTNPTLGIICNDLVDESKLYLINKTTEQEKLLILEKPSDNFNEKETIADKLTPESNDDCGNLENNVCLNSNN